MAFKDYFINSDEGETKKVSKPADTSIPESSGAPIKFPDASTVAVATPTPVIGSTNCEPHMEAVMKLYETGFESLNQPGVEFFEYFKSVVGAGIDSPGAYTMALNMLKGMDASMTKGSLLSQSKFYVDEITKVWNGYDTSGTNKETELANQRDSETNNMQSELTLMEQQLQTLSNQIESKKIAINAQTQSMHLRSKKLVVRKLPMIWLKIKYWGPSIKWLQESLTICNLY